MLSLLLLICQVWIKFFICSSSKISGLFCQCTDVSINVCNPCISYLYVVSRSCFIVLLIVKVTHHRERKIKSFMFRHPSHQCLFVSNLFSICNYLFFYFVLLSDKHKIRKKIKELLENNQRIVCWQLAFVNFGRELWAECEYEDHDCLEMQ